MLETYFVKPQTVDRIGGSWIGAEIERYVAWLAEHGYGARTVWRRVPLLAAFGEFARLRGARTVEDLPAHVDPFVSPQARTSASPRKSVARSSSSSRWCSRGSRAPALDGRCRVGRIAVRADGGRVLGRDGGAADDDC